MAELEQALIADVASAQDAAAVDQVRAKYLGRHGLLQALWQVLPQMPPDEKPQFGQRLNTLKTQWTQAVEARRMALAAPAVDGPMLDLTLPGHPPAIGHRHPITQVIDQVLGVFERLGFAVIEGPEIETAFHNFDALNIPPDHPSREAFDTFFVNTTPETLLRSHTSPVQVRYLEAHADDPRPFRIVVPGRVYRPDALDASHCFQFHQIEGLVVEPGVTFADLKGLLAAFVQAVFGPATRLRFRPHFFPFTEPSAEADISCIFCRGHGCRVCGQKGWLEILGAGMVHPRVFAATRWPTASRGLAFGLGVERIAMLRYGIDDIRLFFENDVRFLHQF
ncbi:MAG: phenylalanine--tRNA ligase subunit alpha [Candidatus Omnitrophica bacterium]|nr:phenylalanine--tRNA ligase subunit alpha [Candidatus Omnitrophota bacterium]